MKIMMFNLSTSVGQNFERAVGWEQEFVFFENEGVFLNTLEMHAIGRHRNLPLHALVVVFDLNIMT